MPKQDRLANTIETVLAAGLDEDAWPNALRAMTELFGSVGTTFEVVDRNAGALVNFWSHGVPAGSELTYAEHYMAASPRMKLADWHRPGDIGYDYMVIDEAGIGGDCYYADFLAPWDMRYFLSVTVVQNASELACLAVQRSPRQGHVEAAEIAIMERIVPRLMQAFDLTRRFRSLRRTERALEHALDWMPEAVIMLRADGAVLYTNRAARLCASRGDGISLRHGRLDFTQADARGRFDRALALLRMPSLDAIGSDFHAGREGGGLPPYIVSVRPVAGTGHLLASIAEEATAVVFIRDPLTMDKSSAGRIAREIFGLTEAEAAFVDALSQGVSVTDYARTRNVSLNTVYTHLRHIKAKTGTKRMFELVARLAELRAPLLDRREQE